MPGWHTPRVSRVVQPAYVGQARERRGFAVHVGVRKAVRGWLRVSPWLASLGCLCACPQILSDDFDPAVTTGAAGAGICSDALCSAGTGGSSIGGAGSGVGGATGGAGASAGVETGGTPGDAGNGGAAAAAGAVGQAGASPEP